MTYALIPTENSEIQWITQKHHQKLRLQTALGRSVGVTTAKHYFLHCKKYNNVRAQSLSALNVAVNIDILLKGCPMYDDTTNRNIFSAVQEYIRLTKRFD